MTTDNDGNVVLSPGQYKTKTAFRIDPLLAAKVSIQQPDWRSRIDNEYDASELRKTEARKHGIIRN